MSCSELPRLCHNETDAVVVISEQIIVAKEKPRAKRRSDDAKFGKDRLHRGHGPNVNTVWREAEKLLGTTPPIANVDPLCVAAST
jgi:hypothetical protein